MPQLSIASLGRLLVKEKRAFFYRALFLFILISPVLLLAIFSYVRTYREYLDSTMSQRRTMAFLAATVVQERLRAIVNLSVSLATRPRAVDAIEVGKWDEGMSIISPVISSFPFMERIVIYDPEGIIKADSPTAVPSVIGQSRTDKEWYRSVTKDWQPYVSGVYQRGAEPRKNVVAVLVPIFARSEAYPEGVSLPDTGRKVIGILQIQLRLDIFSGWLDKISVGSGGLVYIVDQFGRIVHHPNPTIVDKNADFSDVSIVQRLIQGYGGTELYYNPAEKEEHIAAYEPVPAFGWGVVLAQPTRMAFAERYQKLRHLAVTYTIILLLAIALAVLVLSALIAQQKAERESHQLAAIVQFSEDAIVGKNLEGIIISWNQGAEHIYGYAKGEVAGSSITILSPPGMEAEVPQILERIKNGDKIVHYETTRQRKDGSLIDVSLTISPIKESDGTIIGASAIARDITDRKNIEAKLAKAMAAQSDFTSMVSHELRTPLGPITEGAAIILDGITGEINPKQRELLDMIKRNAQRLGRLINNVLDFQKLQSGTEEFLIRSQGIAGPIQEVCHAMALMAKPKGLELIVDIAPELPEISFDRDKIIQVLTNFLNNAIKFTDKGGIKIRAFKEANAVHVVVEDTGPGIAQDDMPKLFQSFQQLDHAKRNKLGGTGLGLAISKSIIARHHGKIWAESEFGRGSAFHFLLPIEERRA